MHGVLLRFGQHTRSRSEHVFCSFRPAKLSSTRCSGENSAIRRRRPGPSSSVRHTPPHAHLSLCYWFILQCTYESGMEGACESTRTYTCLPFLSKLVHRVCHSTQTIARDPVVVCVGISESTRHARGSIPSVGLLSRGSTSMVVPLCSCCGGRDSSKRETGEVTPRSLEPVTPPCRLLALLHGGRRA